MFKYCPQCRRPSPDFIDNKKTQCPDCGFVLFQNTAAAVAVLVKLEKRYIILRRGRQPGQGLLDLPGGFADPGETAEECCHREIREELGVKISRLRYRGSQANVYPYKNVTYHTCDLFFVAECEDTNLVRQEDEIDEILLLEAKDIDIELFAFKSIRQFLKDYLLTIGI